MDRSDICQSLDFGPCPVMTAPCPPPAAVFEARLSPLYMERSAEDVHIVSEEEAAAALATDAVARRILAKGIRVQHGDRVGSRLNLNVFNRTSVAVNTVHLGSSGDGYTRNCGWWRGAVVSYRQVVCLRNAYFNVGQAARERIAAGLIPKEPMASVDGEFDDVDFPSYDGIELHMNPKREHLFRDLNGYAVRRAQSVTVVGHSCFVRGIVEYYREDNAPPRAGITASQAKLLPAALAD